MPFYKSNFKKIKWLAVAAYLQLLWVVFADDVLEVDDVLVREPRQHLHLSHRALAIRLKKRQKRKSRVKMSKCGMQEEEQQGILNFMPEAATALCR
jgi:hypothetical protein